MNKAIGIIITGFILFACDANHPKNVVTGKSFETYMNEPMPPGLCRFWIGSGSEAMQFTDSCHFYHILDTIK